MVFTQKKKYCEQCSPNVKCETQNVLQGTVFFNQCCNEKVNVLLCETQNHFRSQFKIGDIVLVRYHEQ